MRRDRLYLLDIVEAAARLSTDLREKQAHIDWQDIVGFRNIAEHQYFAVNWEIVWITASRDAPLLKDHVRKILAESFPEGGAPDR